MLNSFNCYPTPFRPIMLHRSTVPLQQSELWDLQKNYALIKHYFLEDLHRVCVVEIEDLNYRLTPNPITASHGNKNYIFGTVCRVFTRSSLNSGVKGSGHTKCEKF